MIQKLRNRDEGFTIIEVLIVLAIAGLILLIVFLAVPALQRSSRNTQRKNDAAALGGAVANYISNNGGGVPVGLGNNGAANEALVCAAGGGNRASLAACGAGNSETAKIGYYAKTGVWLNAAGAAAVTLGAAGSGSTTQVSTTDILIDEGYSC